MRPLAAYQQGINAELVAALEELHQALAALRLDAASERARLLSELRALRASQPRAVPDEVDELEPER
jgi:hypothetical protein